MSIYDDEEEEDEITDPKVIRWNDLESKSDKLGWRWEIPNRRAKCDDLHAFRLLEELVGDSLKFDMISASEHDQIWLAAEFEILMDVATDEQILELIRCGVHYDKSEGGLYMYV